MDQFGVTRENGTHERRAFHVKMFTCELYASFSLQTKNVSKSFWLEYVN